MARAITIHLLVLLVAFSAVTREIGGTDLRPPKNGMLVMNTAKDIAVAFCPEGSFLVKNGQPLIFPGRYIKKEETWEPEPVDPQGGLVPIPDCVPVTVDAAFANFADHYQFSGECQSKEIQEEMKLRYFALGVCEDRCEGGFSELKARCG